MGKHREDKNIINEFFKEEGINIIKPDPLIDTQNIEKISSKPPPRQIIQENKKDQKQTELFWRKLRQFFRSGNEQLLTEQILVDPVMPTNIDQDKSGLGSEYPIWLPDEDSASGCSPLFPLMEKTISNIFKNDQGTILKDNLHRLFLIIVSKISLAESTYIASTIIDESLEELQNQLKLNREERMQFEKNVTLFLKGLPQTGILLPFSTSAPFVLLSQVLQTERETKRKQFEQEFNPLILKLRDILEVEKRKSPETTSAEKLEAQLDFATSFVKFEKLSSLIQQDADAFMSRERMDRLVKLVAILENASSILFDIEGYIIASQKWIEAAPVQVKPAFKNVIWKFDEEEKIFELATKVFDEEIQPQVSIFAALNLAKLEINNQYDPQIHDDYFALYNWKSLSEKEMAFCKSCVVLASTDDTLGKEMHAFSKLLASNRPINYLIFKDFQHQESIDPDQPSFRQELGPFTFAHRNTHFYQFTNVNPLEIYQDLVKGIRMSLPSVGHIMNPHSENKSDSYYQSIAAVEGRGFPGLTYDPQAGSAWGKRFSISNNPDPQLNWPAKSIEIQNGSGDIKILDLAFTYAHYLLFLPSSQKYFRIIPSEYWKDNLIPIDSYLDLSREEAFSELPFIWIIDQNHTLQKVLVAAPVVLKCRERLDYWRSLQEFSGIRSYHVEEAIQTLKTELENKFNVERKDLESAFNKKLAQVKSKATQESMGQLARYLLDLGSGTISLDTPLSQTEKIEKEDPVEITSGPEPPTDQKTEDHGSDYGPAYIDTPLCTSCNECIDINRDIFGYDENKQAYIKNKNGLFSHLVKAAEKCPVRIIHPGTPANMQEKNIEKWIKRAEPFN